MKMKFMSAKDDGESQLLNFNSNNREIISALIQIKLMKNFSICFDLGIKGA